MATLPNPELFVIVEGDSQPFPVDYVPNESVGALKVRIKEAKKNDLDYLDADKLTLCKAVIPKMDFKSAVSLDNVAEKVKLDNPRVLLLTLNNWAPLTDVNTYIIVRKPPEEQALSGSLFCKHSLKDIT
ncbi:hypothetical protein BGZ46_001135 [Entomortierella lignicola]|nr:hypothetical protein BGZ46_001135 [Entomortierella lignicola]